MKDPYRIYKENQSEVCKKIDFTHHVYLHPVNNPYYAPHLPVA